MLLDDSTRVAEKARQAGVDLTLEVFDGLWHVFHVFYRLMPEAKDAVKALGVFIRNHFG
jgi:acetyl esterase/lipase